MPKIVKAGAVGLNPGVWAPKNQTLAAITGADPVSGIIVFWTNGSGQRTDANWTTAPRFKWNGVVIPKIGGSFSTTSNGGSQLVFFLPTTVGVGNFQIDTATDYYVDAGIMTYAFVDEHTGIGSPVAAWGGHTALVTTGIEAAEAGSLILSHAVGIYTGGSMHLRGGSPTPVSAYFNSTASSDLTVHLATQEMIANGPSEIQWQPNYNETNAITVEFKGSSAPAKQTLNPPGIDNSPNNGLGHHLAKDPNKALLAPLAIVNTETVLGAPVITRQNVVYYELNGPGNVASGSPAVTVERVTESSNYRISRASTPIVYGEKKYFEVHVDAIAAASKPAIGVSVDNIQLHLQLGGWQSDAIGWDNGGNALDNNTGMNGRPLWAAGDTLMIAVDMTEGHGWVFTGKNGVWYNSTQAGVNFVSGDGRVNNTPRSTSVGLYPAVQTQNIGDKLTSNFGKEPFLYTPPEGFTGLDTGGPAKKTLNVPSIANVSEFGAAEVKLVLTAIYPPSIVNASGMGGHSLIQLAKTVSIENVSVLGNHNVRPVLKPAGLLNTSFLGSHAVGHILKATGIANVSLLGNHKVNSGVSVPGIENTSLLGLHALKTSYQITAPAIVNDNAFGTHQVNQGIKAGGLVNESTLGDPAVLAGKVEISPAGILNESACGTPVVNLALHFVGFNNENGLGDHFVTHIYEDAGIYVPSLINLSVMGEHRIKMSVQMQGIGPTDPVFGSHMVTHVPKLSPAGIVNVSALGTHKLAVNMKPLGIVNNSQVGTHEVKLLPLEVAMTSIVNASETGSHKLAYGIRVSGIVNVSECGQHSIRLGALLAPSIINDNHLGNHEIRIVVGENDKFIRHDGQWRAVETLLVKYDSQWHELDKILEKKDGVWVQIF